MSNNKNTNEIARHIAQGMLSHPDTVVVVDENGRLCLTYQDELQPTQK